MSYHSVIGLLNTGMSAIFCASLLLLWHNHRHLTYIGIFVLSYAVRALCFGMFYFAFAHENPVLRLLANAFLMLAISLLSIGLSSRRGRRPRYGALLSIAVLALGALYYYQFVEPSLLARVIILNLGLAAVSLLMLPDIAKLSNRTPASRTNASKELIGWLSRLPTLSFAR